MLLIGLLPLALATLGLLLDSGAHWIVGVAALGTLLAAALLRIWIIEPMRRSIQRHGADEANFSKLFELSPLPMVYTSATDDYTSFHRNDAWFNAFGYPREGSSTRSATELGMWVNPEDADEMRRRTMLQQPISNWAVELICADQSRRWFSFFGRFTVGPDRVTMISTLIDITEQRQAQQDVLDLNTQLEDRVDERTRQLQAANHELSQALVSLRQAQDHLVQSEKLAALGALVAGVAHELNTPIGNGLTVASSLLDKTRDFALAANAPLQRSVLAQFVTDSVLAADILVRNLSRAATLVSSFKQVAVDRTSSQRRAFELYELLDEVVLTLNPAIRRSLCEVHSQIAPGLRLDSYPGPLGQVLTNLIDNALVHGFTPNQSGRVDISSSSLGANEVEISVRDNGRGIDASHLKRVFDPFFTTRLGQGGSGLGLHIVHNIVTGVLGGRVDVHTPAGGGAQFVLRLPLIAPKWPDLPDEDDNW